MCLENGEVDLEIEYSREKREVEKGKGKNVVRGTILDIPPVINLNNKIELS